ncbi:short-chain dehydrogenase [bacteria symbiont BFo1 of Frankliniella occidentalis]|uniref:Short chain dehydrogenase n=1 Tax=Erwinia aphidicola TaxID=68334 RepID=A0ABU8DD84_ERWAP|nr:short-chain dehydrogenase [bacteria symbiont BFo1 of Frankliniella occidentalis]PIJ58571.1 short chain dehydrogenase [Erwinia sp. OLMDLW33]
MKILVIGASGTVGQSIVNELSRDHQVIRVGKTQGDFQVDLTREESVKALFARTGKVDAVISATGGVHFGPLGEMTSAQFDSGLQDKLMGQVRLVLIGKAFVNPGGSFTLTSGILAQQPIRTGVNATTVNAALEGFVLAAANELNGLRINAVSPTVLTESLESYGPFFPGFESAPASRVALAYRRSVDGNETGRVYRVW